jgi:hypothetical protein
MPDHFRLSPQDYAALRAHLDALATSLQFLEGVSRGLSPGAQVSVEAAYQYIWQKTDTALRAHLLHSQAALHRWEIGRLQHALHQTPVEEDPPHA